MMYKITQPLFMGAAIFAPFSALNAESPEKVLAWVGAGIVFALLSLMSAVAVRDAK